ncbi:MULTISPECIES: DUF397 domain-containing protein [unclassified Streptomyces]|uniref:DUF397 domain-containing protein n=1 Tax=unclassified Streptomyces TaxID=2593676 RepID=UPI00364AD6BF
MSTDSQLEWFKSSYSGSEGDDCVEVALVPGAVRVRDSKQSHGPRFEVASPAWAEFLGFVG